MKKIQLAKVSTIILSLAVICGLITIFNIKVIHSQATRIAAEKKEGSSWQIAKMSSKGEGSSWQKTKTAFKKTVVS